MARKKSDQSTEAASTSAGSTRKKATGAKTRKTTGTTTRARKQATTKPAAESKAKISAVTPSTATGQTVASTPSLRMPTHQEIALRAYDIWVSKGRPHGRDAENWRQAEQELLAQTRKETSLGA